MLSKREMASYGLGAVGKDMVYMFSASYILYYYQDILGVSAIAMGMILMAARVFDAFNDPVWGLLWQRQGHGSGSSVRGCLWERRSMPSCCI